MTINDEFSGAILILTDATRASEIADRIATGYFQDSEYHFKVTESIPSNLPSDLSDQAGAKLRDSPKGSVVLTVYPYDELAAI